MEKTIHDLKLHERMIIEISDDNLPNMTWWVTRVQSGWIYQDARPHIPVPNDIFVSYNPNINF